MQPKKFGEYLRSLRNRKGLTMRQLEDLSGISRSYISQIENGKRDIPSLDVIKSIHEHLDVTYEHLLQEAGYSVDTEYLSFPDLKSMLQQGQNENVVYYDGIILSSQQCKLLREILDEFIKS